MPFSIILLFMSIPVIAFLLLILLAGRIRWSDGSEIIVKKSFQGNTDS